MNSEVSLVELPAYRARTRPDAPCLDDGTTTLTNGLFEVAVATAAEHMVKLGVGRGDIVALMLPNRAEMIVALFAAWRIGAAITPINPALTAAEASYQLEDSGSKLVVVDDHTAERVTASTVLALPVTDLTSSVEKGYATTAGSDLSEVALLIYTSGTTGRPKGVVIDHSNIAAMCSSLIEALDLTEKDSSLLVLPLFHANGLVVGTVSPLWAGGSVRIGPRFDPNQFWSLVEQVRPTYFSAVPTMYAMLAALPPEITADTSSLRFAICGAAPMPASLIHDFESRYAVDIAEGYGLSEGTVASTLNPVLGPRKPGTVGRPLPGQTVAVVNEDGQEVPRGERGEVVIGGPTIMRGYWNQPEETATTLRGGVLHTGDVGYFDDDGYLVLVDRIKDMIIRGGENIYPKEIETVLYSHHAVLEAAVIGRPDERLGEVVIAYVALKPEFSVSANELLEHCRSSLASYKVPTEILVEPSLPKNSVGKLIKGPLRSRTHSTK